MLTRRNLLTGAAVIAPAIVLGACSSSQITQVEQDALQAIEEACQLVPIGTVLAATVLSSVPTLAPAAPIVQTIGQTIDADCNAFVTAIQAAVGAINSANATATVTVSSSSAAPAAMKALRSMAHRAAAKYRGSVVAATPQSITFVIPPSGL